MTGAMYAAVSGMKNHMSKLNVIGNNVANVNTVGYKAGSVGFMESLYTTVKAGSSGSAAKGGTNPAQIGYGMSIGTISLDMSTKQYVPDGNPLHCMISGDGFFMTGPKTTDAIDPNDTYLSRVGDFRFDEDGYLVDGRGNLIYGFMSASGTPTGGGSADYAGPGTATVPPTHTPGVSTQLSPIRLPLSAAAGNTIPDPAGGTLKEGDPVYAGVDATGKLQAPTVGVKDECVIMDGISIDANGKVTGTTNGKVVVVGYVAIGKVANPQGVTHVDGPYYQSLGGAGKVNATSINGSVFGNLNNAATAPGSTMISSSGGTEMVGSGLESSGTDIATEFSEMITTQRGYQANTRIITVTDSMLEELVNIKR